MDTQIQTLLYNILLTFVTTATPILVGYIVVFIKNHISAQQLKTAQSIATNGVIFAQQVSKELGLDNQAKLNSALSSAKALALKYGINLTDDQWKNLLEPALNEAKKGWKEVTDVPTTPVVSSDSGVNNVVETPVFVGNNVNNVVAPASPVVSNAVSVPQNTMQEINNAILLRATNDAELAVKNVISTVQQAIETPVNPAQ